MSYTVVLYCFTFVTNLIIITMKFALYEFCEDSSCDVGESLWMVGEDDSSFNNDDWVMK